ncbi:uncharacterized protein ARMOST_19824 [Armillaria ostoyae]|uniref:Uncharacterized protein n=1 Tax=Armillaria ostoyae TaxID=47428 RepID=A0A284S5L0_ARMOS|nr:uncharacterized protein ARMOST_19824 [Armillaria ostoyae]
MIDSAYPYGLSFIDFELSTGSANSEYYSFIDTERHRLLSIHSVPRISSEYEGWWMPSGSDLNRSLDMFRQTGSGPLRPLHQWFHLRENYVYTWLAERPPPWEAPSPPLDQPSQCGEPDELITMGADVTSKEPPVIADEEEMVTASEGGLDASMVELSMSWDAFMEGDMGGLGALDSEDGFSSCHQL